MTLPGAQKGIGIRFCGILDDTWVEAVSQRCIWASWTPGASGFFDAAAEGHR
jgi:hypothetical protein